jgi:transposase
MPRAYSVDLRLRVMAAYRGGMKISDICTQFQVSRDCVYDWRKLEAKKWCLDASYAQCTGRIRAIQLDEKFEEFVKTHAHSTLKKMVEAWGKMHKQKVSVMAMSRALKRLGWTQKKKTIHYQECSEERRQEFLTKLAEIPEDLRVWVDETGIDDNEITPYGRSPKGERCFAVRSGKKTRRISIISGLVNKKLLAPCWFEGMCHTTFFNAYVEEMLLKEAPKGATFIWDNASFHLCKKLKQSIEKAGYKILLLPPYSPQDNKIEHEWSHLKNTIRKILQTIHDIQSAVEAALIIRC